MDPRVYKWLLPGIAMVAMVPLAGWSNMVAEKNGWAWMLWCSVFLFGAMPILGIQAWAAFSAYYRRAEVQDFVDKRNALANTAEVRQFEYARTMHPETVKLLLMQRKTIWRVKEAKPGEVADWVLDADPTVRVAFVEYVLENSTRVKIMPMNGHLSEGAHDFSPKDEKWVTDYEQYRSFHRILINRGMATEAFGNQPGQWIEPWKPELVAAHFGIRLDQDDAPVPTPPPAATSPDPSTALRTETASQPAPAVEREVSDADMKKINALEIARATLSPKDYVKFCQSQS